MSDKQKVKVVVDVHEPDDLLANVLLHEDVEDVHVAEGGLPSADLVVGGVGFERKTPSDFASSITDDDRNIYDQVQRMTEQYDHSYVLIEGAVADFETLEHSEIPAKSLRGAMASITARYCPVIPTGGKGGVGDMELLVDMAIRIGRKHNEDSGHHYMQTTSAGDDAPFIRRMFACMDGVGPQVSRDLAEAFPTVEQAMQASVEDFRSVEGIGDKRAQNVYETLHEQEEPDGDTERVIL